MPSPSTHKSAILQGNSNTQGKYDTGGCAGKHFQGQLKFTIACRRAVSSSPALPSFGPARQWEISAPGGRSCELVYFASVRKHLGGEGRGRRLIMKERELRGRILAQHPEEVEKKKVSGVCVSRCTRRASGPRGPRS